MKDDTHGNQHSSSSDNDQSMSRSTTPGSPSSSSQAPGHNSASGISSSTTGTTPDTSKGVREPGLAGSNTPSGNTQGSGTNKAP